MTSSSAWPTYLVRGAVVAAVGVAIHLFLAQVLAVPAGLPLDDAWIHAAFARNLAEARGWQLFPPVSGGETSPLWPLLLAPGELIPGVGAPRLALFLGIAAWLLLPSLVGELQPRAHLRWPTAAAVAMCGPLVFHALSGMETLPTLTLCCLALLMFSRGRPRAAAWWAGAACWLRPDAVLLGLVLAVGEIDARRDEGTPMLASVRGAFVALWPTWLCFAAAAAWLGLLGEGFPPSTMSGRRWALGLSSDLSLAGQGEAVQRFLWSWPRAISRELGLGLWSASWPSPLGAVARTVWKVVAALVVTLGVLAATRDAGRPRHAAAFRLLVVWSLWMLVFYCLVLPDRGHVGRYQPQVYLALAGLGAGGIVGLLRSRLRMAGVVATLVLLVGTAGSVVIGGGLWARSVQHLDRVHGRAAEELAPMLAVGATIAVFDVGRIAYDASGSFEDISGLTDRSLLRAMESGTLHQALLERGVTHVLLPVFGDDDDAMGSLRDRLGLGGPILRRLHSWESPEEIWAPSFHYAGHAYRQLVLYRLLASESGFIGR